MPMIQLLNPYCTGDFTWLKGNLHSHTLFSDGERSPEDVIADYQQRGYDFLAISDHDFYVPVERYQQGTTMTLLPAAEVTALGPHILQIGIPLRIEPDADRQRVLDDIRARGGLAILNHPNWEWHFNHFRHEFMEDLEGATGLEVYNGVIERLEGSALASDRWDRLLSMGNWLWGFANDDSHRARDVGVAWNVVQASEATPAAILQAFRQGQFYASTGVVINDIRVDGASISIRTENAQRIRFVSRWGVVRASVDSEQAQWQVPDEPKQVAAWRYVRIECYGPRGQMAWMQPIKIEIP
ncbi:MAG: CehA/McbA family metallohydrolase [Chloroflexi bacterium]|nr:CehA/McbA family metallohydrolase [Chloroflexota bacterium]MCL5274713.1 CehA/McbA family metallohydrolase [Chloroflexota bacterium]